MEGTAESEKQERRDRRRAWWLIGGTLTLFVAAIGYVVFFYDIAAPDDSWLLPEPFAAASGPDSIPELVKKAKTALESMSEERAKLPEDVRMVTAAKAPEARAFVEKHRTVLDEFNAFIAVNREPLPFPGGDQGASFGADSSYLSMLQSGANLVAMNARVLAQEGRKREALEQSLALIRLGWQLANKGGFLIHWLVAITVQNVGRATLEYTANLHPFTEEDIKLVEATLAVSEITSHAFRNTMQVEYLGAKRTLAELRKTPAASFGAMSVPAWAGYTFKPNLTMDSILELEQPVFEACDRDWRAAFAAATLMFGKIEEMRRHHVRRFFNASIGGNFLIALIIPVQEKIFERSVRTAAYHQQMVLMLALRRFELEHGTLPGKLDELCPKYLARVPLDPYNNEAMRWNASTFTVYSVGKDFKDDGGKVSKPVSSKDLDVGMVYWWAKAKP